MIYEWKCKACDRKVEIITNKFEHSDVNPDEIKEDEVKVISVIDNGKPRCKHHWQRLLGGFKLARGNNWKGSKGNW